MALKTISEVMTPLCNVVRMKTQRLESLSVAAMTEAIANDTYGAHEMFRKNFEVQSAHLINSSAYDKTPSFGEYDFSVVPVRDVTIDYGEYTPSGGFSLPSGAFSGANISGCLRIISEALPRDSENLFNGATVGGKAVLDLGQITSANSFYFAKFTDSLRLRYCNTVSVALTHLVAPYVVFDERVAFTNGSLNDSLIYNLVLANSRELSTIDTANIGTIPIIGATRKIYVPRTLRNAYQAATNWSNFADQIYAIEDDETVYELVNGGESE